MYEPRTILVLKKPRSTEDNPFPYDRVEVIGQSPVSHGHAEGEWAGANAQGVIVRPLVGFGANLDEPYGKLKELYDVDEVPTNEVPANPVRVIHPTSGSAGPTPEEQFADQATDAPVPDGKRGRTNRSPLDNEDTEALARAKAAEGGSPLDKGGDE